MEHELDLVNAENADGIIKVERSITVTRKYVNQMRKHIEGHKFKSQKEEIYFFKAAKPQICSRLIYYMKVYSIESKRPIGTLKSERKYFQGLLDQLQNFYNDNLEFHLYYRRNATHLDDKYFINSKTEMPMHLDSIYGFWDGSLYSSHDHTVTLIKANDLLRVYLKTELKELNGIKKIESDSNSKDAMVWTDSKVSLVELVYAIHEVGSINKGSCDIKTLTSLFEQIFQVDLGDCYHTYLEIKMRNNPTKYLDSLKSALIKKIEQEN
jgi:copper chaperone CopZ